MKFIKKAAALIFCLALALSVMAISASADNTDPSFTLTLEQASTPANFTNHDDADGIEVASASTVTYNMKLSFTNTEVTTPQAVSSLSFKVADVTGMTTAVTFYEGANSGNTQAATTKTTSGVTSYSFSAGGNSNNDFSLTSTNQPVTIGTITFAVSSTLNHQTVTPAISAANLQTRVADNFNRDKFDVTVTGVDTIQVNPVYTMTLKKFTADTTTGQLPKSGTAYAPNETETLYYDYEGGIYSETTNYTSAALGKAPTVTAYEYATGYTNSGWKVTSTPNNANSGWASVNEQAALNSVPDNRVGNVELTAQYSPISYNYKFDYNGGKVGEATQSTGTYTIESPVTLPTRGSIPTLTGYDFKGWSASQGTDYTETRGYNTSIWTTLTGDYSESNTTGLITSLTTNKVYGDVVLTAVWDEAGVFHAVAYAYAGITNNSLVLYAVNSDDNVSTDTYKYSNNAMFKVPAEKATVYLSNTAFTEADKEYLGESYVMYAYIGVTSGAAKGLVTIDKTSSGGNTELAYDGNVYRDNGSVINTADYGNVDALLGANGGSALASTFSVEEVRARLEADMVNHGDTVSASRDVQEADDLKYGSIWDIKKIISMLT